MKEITVLGTQLIQGQWVKIIDTTGKTHFLGAVEGRKLPSKGDVIVAVEETGSDKKKHTNYYW